MAYRRINNMMFNDWLYENYGIFKEDLTDEDYDRYYSEYLKVNN